MRSAVIAMQAQVKDITGAVVGTVDLRDDVWAQEPNDALLHQVVVAQLSNRRQGTHESKTRAQVSYSTRKLRGQKRSGRARMGSRKSPTLVGGGVIFGPHSRSYRKRVPRKMRRQALRIALSEKAHEDRLTVLESLEFESPKTKQMASVRDALGCNGRTLLVTDEKDPNVVLSARGLPKFDAVSADMLNATLASAASNLVVTKSAAGKIEEIWGTASEDATP